VFFTEYAQHALLIEVAVCFLRQKNYSIFEEIKLLFAIFFHNASGWSRI
jgi:hypothetical protein